MNFENNKFGHDEDSLALRGVSVEDSAGQYSRVQAACIITSGSGYRIVGNSMLDPNVKIAVEGLHPHETVELVRRANALPAAQAQLAEAVELLRRMAVPDSVGHETEAIWRYLARDFLAKVDAP